MLSLLNSSDWMKRSLVAFPPKGFVGRASLSSLDTALENYRIASIHLHPIQRTSDVPLWRLTFEWEINPPHELIRLSGGL